MGIFSDLNKNFDSPFKIPFPDDVEYKKLEDLNIEESYQLVSCYVNPKSKFGAHPVAGVIDNDGIIFMLSLPKHLTNTFEIILSEPRYIDAINEGACRFKIKKCHSKKYDKDFYSIDFLAD